MRTEHERWVINCLRGEYDMEGIPIRLLVRSSLNVISINARQMQHRRRAAEKELSDLVSNLDQDIMDLHDDEEDEAQPHTSTRKKSRASPSVVGVRKPDRPKVRLRRDTKYKRALVAAAKAKGEATTGG